MAAVSIACAAGAYALISSKTKPTTVAAVHPQDTARIFRPIIDTTRPVDDKIAETIRALEPKAPLVKPATSDTATKLQFPTEPSKAKKTKARN